MAPAVQPIAGQELPGDEHVGGRHDVPSTKEIVYGVCDAWIERVVTIARHRGFPGRHEARVPQASQRNKGTRHSVRILGDGPDIDGQSMA